jgi:hypothetical protein
MQLAAAMDRAGGATALVPPGRYAAWRARRGPGGTVCVRADRDVDVVAGDDNDFALAFAGATGRVRLLTEDGPLCGAIVLPVPNCFVLPGFVTDADGWLAFDELPSARCELEHRAFDPTTSVEVVRRWIVTAADLGREVRAQE